MAVVNGIELSAGQRADMEALRQGGTEFVILPAGTGGREDPLFLPQVQAAQRAGMKWGPLYILSEGTVPGALAQAEHFLRQMQGLAPSLPAALALRDRSVLCHSKETATDAVCAFLIRVGGAVGPVSILASADWYEFRLDFQKLRRFDIWLERWGKFPAFSLSPIGLWQYTDRGQVPGAQGPVRQAVAYRDYGGKAGT